MLAPIKQPIEGHLPPLPYLQPPQNGSHSSLELVPALVAFMYHLLQSAGCISAILPSKSPVLLVYKFQMSKTLMNLPLKGLDWHLELVSKMYTDRKGTFALILTIVQNSISVDTNLKPLLFFFGFCVQYIWRVWGSSHCFSFFKPVIKFRVILQELLPQTPSFLNSNKKKKKKM